MGFQAFWPLWLLILVPVIIILYMLKQKAKNSEFSSTLLWEEVYKNIWANKPLEKLKLNILMLLQIFFVLLLIFLLMKPYIKTGGGSYTNTALVLDSSGSMNAFYKENITRFEEAKIQAKQYIDSLPQGTSMTIISCNKEANVEAANTVDKATAKKTIDAIGSTHMPGDLSPSLSMLNSLVDQWEDYQIILYSDTGIDIGSLNATLVDMYSDGVNLSLDSLSHGYEDDRLVVLAQVTNYSEEVITTDINLYGGDRLIDIKEVTIPAKDSISVYFDQINATETILRAEINESDLLMVDNTAYDILDKTEKKKAILLSDGNLFLETVIKGLPNVELYKANNKEYVNEKDQYDLYIFDGIIPESLPESGNILFLGTDHVFDIESVSEEKGVILSLKASSITRYIEDFEFGANLAYGYKKPDWATEFINMGEYSAGFYGEYQDRKIGVLAFDLHQSDFVLQSEFPVLLTNLFGEMIKTGILMELKYPAGNSVPLHMDMRGGTVLVKDSEDNSYEINTEDTEKAFIHTKRSGLYHVSQTVEKSEIQEAFIVEFPVETESNQENIPMAGEQAIVTKKLTGAREVSTFIYVIAFLLLFVEWLIYLKQQ